MVAALFCCKKDKTKNIYSIQVNTDCEVFLMIEFNLLHVQCSTKEGGVALEVLHFMVMRIAIIHILFYFLSSNWI